jgi:hypothetical protein
VPNTLSEISVSIPTGVFDQRVASGAEDAMSANDNMKSSGRPFVPSCAIQGSELFIRKLDIDRGNIFLQMRDL